MPATILFDDAELAAASNDHVASAQLMRKIVNAANALNARPRPIANRIGGNDNHSEVNAEPQVRGYWYAGASDAPMLTGIAGILPVANTASVPLSGLRLKHKDHTQSFTNIEVQGRGAKEDQNDNPELWYPQFLRFARLYAEHASASDGVHCREMTVQSGESGVSFGPQIRSLMIATRLIEARSFNGVNHPIMGVEALPTEQFSLGSEIWGEAPDSRSMKALRDFIIRLWREKRPMWSWNMSPHMVAGTQGHQFDSGSWRYILNPLYGSAPNIIPTETGPGMRVPLTQTAQGLRTTIRVYIRIYARMAGAGTGTIAVYNRDNLSAVVGPTAITNAPTVTGTTWQWWPNATTFNPATDPYFYGNASTSYTSDIILPVAKANSGTMEVSAVALHVYPSTA